MSLSVSVSHSDILHVVFKGSTLDSSLYMISLSLCLSVSVSHSDILHVVFKGSTLDSSLYMISLSVCLSLCLCLILIYCTLFSKAAHWIQVCVYDLSLSVSLSVSVSHSDILHVVFKGSTLDSSLCI